MSHPCWACIDGACGRRASPRGHPQNRTEVFGRGAEATLGQGLDSCSQQRAELVRSSTCSSAIPSWEPSSTWSEAATPTACDDDRGGPLQESTRFGQAANSSGFCAGAGRSGNPTSRASPRGSASRSAAPGKPCDGGAGERLEDEMVAGGDDDERDEGGIDPAATWTSRNPDDRRAYVISLTAGGRRAHARPRRPSTNTPSSSSDRSPSLSGRSSTGCSHASSSDPRSGTRDDGMENRLQSRRLRRPCLSLRKGLPAADGW